MDKQLASFTLAALLLAPLAASHAAETTEALGITALRHSVVSDVPAATWEKAMVTGNGIQGAMAMGRAPDETIVLNHAGLFLPLAAPFSTVNQARILPELRQMIEEGKFKEAGDRIFDYGLAEGKNGGTWTDPFVPACSLQVDMPQRGAPRGYLRGTDFSTGVTGTRWDDEAGLHVRRLFVSRPDNVVVLSLTGTNGVDCDLNFILHDPKVGGAAPPRPDAVKDATAEAEAGEGGGWLTFRVSYTHRWPGSLQGCEVAARVIAPGGTTTAANGKLAVRGAKDVLVLVRTTLSRDIGQSQLPSLRAALGKLDGSYDNLLARHTAVHGEIMKRCQLDLGGSEADHRLTAPALFAKSRVGALNAALLEKEFDACRYLVLSSSGPEYPPTLQGIWGATWKPAWSGDYTQDGNLQTVVAGNLMANMPEAMEGFFHYLEVQLPDYRDNARRQFGTRGIHVAHRTSTHGLEDRWVRECPMTFWTAGAAWNAQFFYDYWLTTGDKKFLLEHALPWMKEAAAFYEDFLYAGPDGKWEFNPSFSPENNGKAPGCALAALNSTMDSAAARELFSNLVTVCGQLGIEHDNVAKWKGILARMPDYKINADGAVAEWNTPLLKDCYSHRHASHLYALFAGLPADIAANPALQAAFKVAIEKRMRCRRAKNGGDMAFGLCQLGWPAANLHDGKTAYETVDWLANNFWFAESLVTSHNIRSIFNTDIAGGLPRLILTMLVQSEPGRLELLPALPKAWPTGRVTGILCRGQVEVRELAWSPDAITVTLRSAVAQQVAVRHDGLRAMKVISGSASVDAPQADGSRLVALPAGRDVTLRLERATAELAMLSCAGAAERLPELIYAPENDAIVIRNGTVWKNRPLYCNHRYDFVMAGEMPSLSGSMGTLTVGIGRGETRMLLQQFAERIARYRPGRMEWELTDPRLPGLTVRLTGTTLADATGFTAQLVVEGVKPGDMAAWCVFLPREGKATRQANGFQFERVTGRFSVAVGQWEQLAAGDREDLRKAAANAAGDGLVAWIPLETGHAQCLAMTVENPAAVADAAQAFADGLARAVAVGTRVVVETPDPYFNAGVGASCAAIDGLYVAPAFAHGGSAWRVLFPGWRVMGGATAYGWHDRVATALEHFDRFQVKQDGAKTNAAPSVDGCEQAGNSRFYGAGFVGWEGSGARPLYEFTTQFFDQCVRDWRATADPAFEKRLLPMLELQLDRCKACFDPDDDGLYESFNNTWPSDSVWFNGGPTPEQSAYVYYARRAAADMRRHAGDTAAATRHDAEAEKIRAAMNRVLWLKDKGQFASHIEQGGHHRIHTDAWVYAQHVPIEAGITTPEQAWQAMYYTEWAMERFKLPYGGEMRQTSNWVPGEWSVRELYHGDNFAMALGYFLGGQGDDGWELLRGSMLQTMYGDPEPKSGFTGANGRPGATNFRSPGGLSHPNCSIDFNDLASMFCRAVVEGLFGYRPDYPNRVVRIEPAFPSAWDHASIRTPDFALAYRQGRYQLTLAKPAALRFRLPVRATKIKQVLVNGQAAKYTLEPWAGYGALLLDVPACAKAEVAIVTEGPAAQLPVLTGEQPDGVPGYHLLINRLEGDVPRYQLTKRHVPEPVETRTLREAPADAKWQVLDLAGQFNGDVQTLFKQDYRSPRPNTASMRIGYDGYSPWTFKYWNLKPPEIKLADPGKPVTTPQRVQFAAPGEAKNIAFTSLWDNWPKSVTVPVNAAGEAVWLLICGSTNPMQGRIANAVVQFRYANGQDEQLELVPPLNFWSLCGFGRMDYDYQRDGFSLPKDPPPQVQLGANCRAMVYGWKLRPGIVLKDVTLETLSQEVVIGLMGVSVMNPAIPAKKGLN